jgi:hypothetical protein
VACRCRLPGRPAEQASLLPPLLPLTQNRLCSAPAVKALKALATLIENTNAQFEGWRGGTDPCGFKDCPFNCSWAGLACSNWRVVAM